MILDPIIYSKISRSYNQNHNKNYNNDNEHDGAKEGEGLLSYAFSSSSWTATSFKTVQVFLLRGSQYGSQQSVIFPLRQTCSVIKIKVGKSVV